MSDKADLVDGKVPEAQLPEMCGGLLPQIIVTTQPGASVTATLEDITIGPVVAGEDGLAVLNVPDYGAWALVAEHEGKTSAASFVDVDAVKQYQIKRQISQFPGGYTELEYIGLTGTQYIDTGLVSFNGITISVRGMTVNGSIDQAFYGAGGSNGRTCLVCDPRQNGFWYINGNGYYRRTPMPVTNTIYECATQHFTSAAPTLEVNGTSLTGGYIESSQMNTTDTLYIGAMKETSKTVWFLTGRIYSFSASNSSAKVADLVPAMRDSDDAVGMLDTVSGTFFTNAGTGSFIAGPEVDGYSNYDLAA